MQKANIPKPIKVLVIIFLTFAFLAPILLIGENIYCNTVAFCEPGRSTVSLELKATQIAGQYELAIQDINTGEYEIAKQRLEYIIRQAPEYPNATEKLKEVKRNLILTPTPK